MVVDIGENQDQKTCALSFVPSGEAYWIFGLNFYRDYYVLHDTDNKRMGFAPSKNSLKSELEYDRFIPVKPLKETY